MIGAIRKFQKKGAAQTYWTAPPLKTQFSLCNDVNNLARGYGSATLTDSELEALFHGYGVDQLYVDLCVVAGHYHFLASRQAYGAGDISGAEVELGAIAGEEGRMATAFFLAQHVHLTPELGVGVDATGLGKNLATLDFFLVDTAEQGADVVTSLTFVKKLVEHFNTGTDGFLGCLDTDYLDFLVHLHDTTVNLAGYDSTATGDGEHVLDGHKEGLVGYTLRICKEGVHGIQKLVEALGGFGVIGIGHGIECRTLDDRGVITGEAIETKQVADFLLHQLYELGIIKKVDLVEENNHRGHANLAGQEYVFTGLGHDRVGSRDDEDRPVHLGCTGDHVLDIVGMAGTVDMGIVPLGRLILEMPGIDGNTTSLLFGCIVDIIVLQGFVTKLFGAVHGNGRAQSGLAVVDVSDGTNIHVGLGTIELLFRHSYPPRLV